MIYTPTPALLPSSVTIPTDGDLKPSISVDVSLEILLDGVAFAQLPAVNSAAKVQLATRTIGRIVTATAVLPVAGTWLYGPTAVPPILTDQGSTFGDALMWPLRIPNGATLTSATIFVTPHSGHGSLPITMPQLNVYKTNVTTGTSTLVASQSDTSASVLLYEARHVIQKTGMAEVIDNSAYLYQLLFYGEGGGGGVNGLRADRPAIGFSTSAMDDGAS